MTGSSVACSVCDLSGEELVLGGSESSRCVPARPGAAVWKVQAWRPSRTRVTRRGLTALRMTRAAAGGVTGRVFVPRPHSPPCACRSVRVDGILKRRQDSHGEDRGPGTRDQSFGLPERDPALLGGLDRHRVEALVGEEETGESARTTERARMSRCLSWHSPGDAHPFSPWRPSDAGVHARERAPMGNEFILDLKRGLATSGLHASSATPPSCRSDVVEQSIPEQATHKSTRHTLPSPRVRSRYSWLVVDGGERRHGGVPRGMVSVRKEE